MLALAASLVLGALALTVAADPIYGPEELVGALARPAAETDVLPDAQEFGTFERVDVASVRLVGRSKFATFWMAAGTKGEVCGIVFFAPKPSEWIHSASCSTTDQFADRGLPLDVGTPSSNLRARFLADGILEEDANKATLAGADIEIVTSNVLVVPEDAPKSVQVSGLEGRVFEVGRSALDDQR